MKLRWLVIFLMAMLAVAGTGFPDAFRIPGAKVDIYADAEVAGAEEFYAVMRDSVRDVKESVKVRIVKYDENTYNIDNAFKRVLAENSGLGFVSGCSATVTRVLGKDSAIVELKLQYQYPAEKVAAMRAETDIRAEEIIKNIINPDMSEYEKVLAIHDHVIKNARYDRLNADSNTVPAEEHEAYGVLVNGIGVCDSYAKAVKLLLGKAGVQCLLVEGSKLEGTGKLLGPVDHAWNIVKLDGEYYHLDATWDDVSEERDSPELIYHHFNLNDKEMQKTHVWDKSKYPPCTGTKYNYFEYNRLVANNRAEAISILAKAVSGKEKKLQLKFADYESSKYNIEELIKKAAEKSRPGRRISAKWIINDQLGVADIEFEY